MVFQAGSHCCGVPQPSACSATRSTSREGGGGFAAWGLLRPRCSRIVPIAIGSVTKAMRLMRWPQRVQTSGSVW